MQKEYNFFFDSKRTKEIFQSNPINDFEALEKTINIINNDEIRLFYPTFPGLKSAITSFTNYIQEENKNFNFYQDVIPLIINWCFESYNTKIPLLWSKTNNNVSLSVEEIRTILSNAFFLNLKSCDIVNSNFGSLNLKDIYSLSNKVAIERIICLLNYFYRIKDKQLLDTDRIEYIRVFKNVSPNWKDINKEITENTIQFTLNRMEESDALNVVDFANCYLHIGKIISSATQEEILFSTIPEAFPALLFCDKLEKNEIIFIKNARRFSDYTGYDFTFKFKGNFKSLKKTNIIAMDASMGNYYSPEANEKDFDKAFIGFSQTNGTKISTGKWGSGAFGGDPTHKFIQQLCAAQLNKVVLEYSLYNDQLLLIKLSELLEKMIDTNTTISKLYKITLSYNYQTSFYDHVFNNL